ncbi:glycosyltransferase [Aldersonia sp. NBC_00410]|uniref:glycosyltransferase n=1 Tax=Aldersonia sp. NBC_00410 TaxID=2975954 RepID=UPI002250C57B|nr:glycosyltransferase [Aldersonia sp. NBC_00410]MCX5043197.1 glycosyltransferase [Aldersonia sp. NBC_00410]
MTRIVIAAYGSTGDIMPLTDFGSRLTLAGHDVVMTCSTDLADAVAERGISARPVDFEIDPGLDPERENPLKLAMQLVKPAGMRQLGNNLLDALEDVRADVVLLSPFAELAGHAFAEARGIPSVGVRLQPVSATGDFPPTLLGSWSAGSWVNRGAGRLAAAGFDRMYGGVIAGFRERLGLAHRSQGTSRRARTQAEWPILHGFSPAVLPRPEDWRTGLDVVGYWWPSIPADWRPPAELVRFLESGPAPVYLGFGSVMLPAEQSAQLSELITEAVRAAGVRAVVQAGGAGLDVTGTDMITVGSVPHEWLFERVCAVAHSCGAGTAGAGLRAGLPTAAIPSPGGDQPFWANRLHHLGAATKPIPRPRLTADKLARAIDTALNDSGLRSRAVELADQIATEDGGARVVTAVEQRVAR